MVSIIIPKEDFKRILKIGGQCTCSSRTIPLCEFVRITTKNDRVKLEASNPNTSIKTYTSLSNPTEEVSFCVNHKDITNYVSAIGDDDVRMNVDTEANAVTIAHTGGELVLPCVDAKDFPEFENSGNDNTVSFDADASTILRWLSTCKDFVSDNELRPALCGALLSGGDGKIGVSASDSKILFNDEVENDNISGHFSLIINSAAFGAITSILEGQETVRITSDEKKVWFTVGSTTLSVLLTKGAFPNVKSIIPANSEHTIALTTKELRGSLKRIGLAVGQTSHVVKFMFEETGLLNIVHENLVASKKATETLSYEQGSGIKFSVGFNFNALSKALNAIDGEDIIMKMNDPKKAVVFNEGDGSSKVILVMPVAI